jgi:putative ABC transport system permease protein
VPWSETLKLAFESLLANKLRAGLTMLGMIIGVGAVVLLVSIGNGAKRYITTQFEGIGTNLIVVQPGKSDTRSGFGPPIGGTQRKLTLGDVQALEKLSYNLDSVTPLMFGTASVKTGNKALNVQVIGSNELFPRVISIKMGQGRFLTEEESDFNRRVIVLGYNISQKLFEGDSPLGKLVKVNETEHRVVGVTQKSGDKLGFNLDEIVFIPTRSAMRIFNEDKLFGIRARAKSKIGVQDAVEEIRRILKDRRQGKEEFTIVTQDAMLGTLGTILNMLTYVLGGIAMISMLVGGIGIMNIMLVSVTERTREIGVRRAVGARQADVLRQFLAEALTLSVVGGMTGMLGSVGITYLVSIFSGSFDMRAPWWIVLPAFGLSVLVGVGFGVWPARKASRMNPIEALRFE